MPVANSSNITTIQILRSYSNTVPATLEDGQLAYSFVSNTLFIGSNTGVQIIGDPSTAVKSQFAYDQANTATVLANASYFHANGSFIKANAAFDNSNTKVSKSGDRMTGALQFFGPDFAIGEYDGAGGIDLWANNNTSHAQLNFANTNFSYVDAYEAALQTPNSQVLAYTSGDVEIFTSTDGSVTRNTWTFNTSGGLIFPDSTTQTTAYTPGGEIDELARGTANAAYFHANGAFLKANAAFDLANAVNIEADAAYFHANGAFVRANAGFATANTADVRSSASYFHANGAFLRANAAFSFANTRANQTGYTANSVIIANSTGEIVTDSRIQFISSNSTFITGNIVTLGTGGNISNANNIFANNFVATFNVVSSGINLLNYTQAAFNSVNIQNVAIASTDGKMQNAYNTANTADVKAQAAFDNSNTKFSSSGGSITGPVSIINGNDLTVTGNLIVLGNVATENVSSFTVADPLIVLGTGNYFNDVKDIGIAAHYNNGVNAHTGIIRDSEIKEWIFFEGYTPELDANNNINIANASFAYANVYANWFKGNVLAKTATVNGLDVYTFTTAGYNQANTGTVLAQAAYNQANVTVGVDATQNTRLTVIEGTDVSQNARMTIIEGVDVTQNTRLTVAEGTDASQNVSLTTQNSFITIIQGVDVGQNSRMTIIEDVDVGQNNRMTIIEGVDVGQNTRMTVSDGVDASQNVRLDFSNASITIIQGVDSTQNNNIQAAWNAANSAYALSNTQVSSGGWTANTVIVANAAGFLVNSAMRFDSSQSLLHSMANLSIGTTTASAPLTVSKAFTLPTAAEQFNQLNSVNYTVADTNLKQNLRLNTTASHTSNTISDLMGLLNLTTAGGVGGTTLSQYGFWARNDIVAGAFVTNSYNYFSNNGSNTGNANNQFGFYTANLTKGLLGNYGFYGAVNTGNNAFNLYMAGTAPNYLAGSLTVANNVPSTSNTTGSLVVSGGVGITGNVFLSAANNFFATTTGQSYRLGWTDNHFTRDDRFAGVTYNGGYLNINPQLIASGALSIRNIVNNDQGNNVVVFGGSSPVRIQNGTASSNTTSGALIVAGGVGIAGALNATTKSFNIPHPTKEGKNLRYGSLEGPEFGVYVRGELQGSNIIELPDYWTKLVDEKTITVHLTPIGKHQKLSVKEIVNNTIVITNDSWFKKEIHCYYTVYGERADVDKLDVES